MKKKQRPALVFVTAAVTVDDVAVVAAVVVEVVAVVHVVAAADAVVAVAVEGLPRPLPWTTSRPSSVKIMSLSTDATRRCVTSKVGTATRNYCPKATCRGLTSRLASFRPAGRRRAVLSPETAMDRHCIRLLVVSELIEASSSPVRKPSAARVTAATVFRNVSAGWDTETGSTPPGHTGTFPAAIQCAPRRTGRRHLEVERKKQLKVSSFCQIWLECSLDVSRGRSWAVSDGISFRF